MLMKSKKKIGGNIFKDDQTTTVFYFFIFITLLMTILTFTWRKNENNVQEIKEKYNVTAFTTN